MANKNFFVHNGLTVGSLLVDATTSNLTTVGTLSSTNTQTSTSTTTGALIVSGGVGFGGDLNVGGRVWGGGVRTTSTNGVAPSNPTVGDTWYDTSTDTLYRYTFDGTSSYWIDNTGPILNSIGLAGRSTVTTATSTLAASSSTSLTVAGYKSYGLASITVDQACWLRIYTDAAARTADASRSITTDPASGSGVIAEIVSSGALTQRMTPCVIGFNLDTPVTSNLYLAVTNLASFSTQINISITLIQLEQ